MDTTKVNRVEVIDHTKEVEEGGGRTWTMWAKEGSVDVTVVLQDEGKTLKVFITN